jgi:glycerate 2-kinase
MAAAFARLRGPRIREALVIGVAQSDLPGVFESIPGGHPVPTDASERAGRRALAVAASAAADETLLVLVSGGASAMMAVPADGITLDDKRRTTDRLLKAGADIYALNTVRKHISAIKGGWLAACASAPIRTFAISDVVGDDLSVIASGPTVADSSTFDEALNVLQRFGGLAAYPAAVVARLSAGQRGGVDETPKPNDPRLARAVSTVIGSRRDAMDAAVAAAESLGYHVVRLDEPVDGEARLASIAHLQAMRARTSGVGRPVCIVSSGETTVRVTGRGKGGRNQEFALAAAGLLASLGAPAVVASVGTDGIDGPTDAAGALVDSSTTSRARAAGVGDAERFLADNNAYAFFAALGDLIQTGPTGTNVGDLQIILFG